MADRRRGEEGHARRLAGEPGRRAGHLEHGVVGQKALERRHVGPLECREVTVEDTAGPDVGRLGQSVVGQGHTCEPAAGTPKQALHGRDGPTSPGAGSGGA